MWPLGARFQCRRLFVLQSGSRSEFAASRRWWCVDNLHVVVSGRLVAPIGCGRKGESHSKHLHRQGRQLAHVDISRGQKGHWATSGSSNPTRVYHLVESIGHGVVVSHMHVGTMASRGTFAF